VSKYKICRQTRDIEHGRGDQKWTETIQLDGYEVYGGIWFRTKHPTLCSAEKEIETRERIDKEFPFEMPRSKRELDYMARNPARPSC